MQPSISPLSFPVSENDRRALQALLRSCVEQGASIGFMLPLEEGELVAYWDKVLADAAQGGRVILVAHDPAGGIVGSVQLALETRRNGRHRAEIQKLMVLPGARRGGLGAALMEHAEDEAARRGVRILFLDTSEGASGARAFYERLGYAYVGGIPDYALDPQGPPAKNAIYYRRLGEVRGDAASGAPGLGNGAEANLQSVAIRPMQEQDWPEVRRIYEEGIATGHSTFQSAAPHTWAQFHAGKVAGCSLVATSDEGACLGWAVLSPTSTRPVYAGVTELSVYIAQAARGRGVGTALLKAVIAASEERGIWTLYSGTFPENVASVRLQLAHGFRIVGTRERIGLMGHGPLAGHWRDLLVLERRSRVVGVPAR